MEAREILKKALIHYRAFARFEIPNQNQVSIDKITTNLLSELDDSDLDINAWVISNRFILQDAIKLRRKHLKEILDDNIQRLDTYDDDRAEYIQLARLASIFKQ